MPNCLAASPVQGLEGLLGGDGGGLRRVSSGARSRDENASPERRGPFLLPVSGGGAGGVEALQGRKALSESAVLPTAATAGNGGSGGAYQQTYAVTFPTRTPAVPVGGGEGAFDGSW
jgi:hypothetical protein